MVFFGYFRKLYVSFLDYVALSEIWQNDCVFVIILPLFDRAVN
jgi:hypothetical protein